MAARLDATVADVRVVHLARGPVPRSFPAWLSVRLTTSVAKDAAPYATAAEGAPAEHSSPRRLWPWSPHHRRPSAKLAEFLRAGATALRHPDMASADAHHQLDALIAFARGREALASLTALRSTALERWLHVTFGEPEQFADALLLARIEAANPPDAAVLRFLREATIAEAAHQHADLAVDRVVLIEQISPWRYLDGAPMAAALAAARDWCRRYARAYAAHYREVLRSRDALLSEAVALVARMETLARLDRMTALGTPDGEAAVETAQLGIAARAVIANTPEAIDGGAAVTAGAQLGAPSAQTEAFRTAATAVEHAFQSRLRNLSAALAGCALDHEDDLHAVLDAIALSEVDHIDRVLNDRLAARIEVLMGAAARSPLAAVARRFPALTVVNLEAAVEEFRRAAHRAIDAAPDGRAVLATPTTGSGLRGVAGG